MTQKRFYADILFKQTLKKEDRIVIPEEEEFYEKMNKKIMKAIENTEVAPGNKWEKPWVFLERQIELNEGVGNLRSDKFKAKVSLK